MDITFPAPSFRPHQAEALARLQAAVNDHAVVVLDAPTGSGKTLLNWTAGRQVGDIYYTTPVNKLVAQVERDPFIGPGTDRTAIVRAKRKYPCLERCRICGRETPEKAKRCEAGNLPFDEAECSCEVGPCEAEQDCEHKDNGTCLYRKARGKAAHHHAAVSTLDYLLAVAGHGDTFGPRPVLVVDECQNLEGAVRRMVETRFTRCPKPCEDPTSFLADTADRLQQEYDSLRDEAWTKFYSKVPPGIIRKLNGLKRKIDKAGAILADIREGNEYHIQSATADDGAENISVRFTPLTIERFCCKFLHLADKIILSSATPGNHEYFLKLIGLDVCDHATVTVPSTFPLRNRRITTIYVGRMNYANRNQTVPLAAERSFKIIAARPGVRGVVHCQSYLNQGYLKRHAPAEVRERLVSYGNGEGDEAYEAWIEDGRQDSVLLSVAMCEGIDLKDDLARFQILFKCPYPAQDEFIRRRMELDDGQQWYTYQAQTATIQAYGRAVRSPEDWAEFWVLDATAEYLFRDTRDLPPFFADAWRMRRTI